MDNLLEERILRDAMLGQGAGAVLRAMFHPHGWLWQRQQVRWNGVEDRVLSDLRIATSGVVQLVDTASSVFTDIDDLVWQVGELHG
jgi:hypothetical protein